MKKAQVTIFVVAGILILFIVALLFYMYSNSIKVRPPVENIEVTDDVKPVQTYVIDCLAQISREALVQLGNNGGYINVTGITVKPRPYESDALYFPPQTLPYWYYMHDCQESQIGCIDSLKPALCAPDKDCILDSTGDNDIETQLSEYVEDNINRCLDDFNVFRDKFDIKAGHKNVEVIITADDVDIVMDYPIDITVKGTKKSIIIQKFAASLDIDFRSIYELAGKIAQGEADTNFLELTALNLISIYSGKDPDKLPPLSVIEFGLKSPVTWTRTEVKRMMMEDVLIYMNFLRILGTKNARQLLSYDTTNYSIYANGIYRSFEINIFNDTVYDLEASISYPYSDIYLNIGDSEIIKPEKLESENMIVRMLGIFMTEYKFKYDLSYPMIVKIHDPNAFGGEGYDFHFALESNIRKNIPVKGNISVITLSGMGGVRLDSELQKVNRTITIESYDKHTGKPLDNVIISYRCDRLYDIGFTTLGSGNNPKALLSDKFPFCQFGGQIIYEKQGYMGAAILYDNVEGNDAKTFKVELWPLQEKNVIVYKRSPTNIANIRKKGTGGIALYSLEVSNITQNETVFLNLARMKNDASESDVPLVSFIQYSSPDTRIRMPTLDERRQQVIDWFNNGQITQEAKDNLLLDLALANSSFEPADFSSEEYKMSLVPGKYSLDAFMTYKGNITIPKKTERICPIPEVLGICIPGRIVIEYPEQHFDTWPNGGAMINFTLTENDIYGDRDTLVLYMLEMPIPSTWDMMEKMQTLQQYQEGKTFLIRPMMK